VIPPVQTPIEYSKMKLASLSW